jgi:hypothetical protein
LNLRGYDTPTNIARGFEWKWKDFRNDFAAVRSPQLVRVRRPKGPVVKVWATCDRYRENLLDGRMTRGQLISRCRARGIREGTASVVYARWMHVQRPTMRLR